MEFFPYEPFDSNEAQKKVWDWLKEAFKNDEGVAYYRYPIFTKIGRLCREPDIVMLHRVLGLWVIECKGFRIGNIQNIQGHSWQMCNWNLETETPVAQAEDEMFAIKGKLDARRECRGKATFNFKVALPNIKRTEWEARGFNNLPSTEGVVLVYEDLTPAALKRNLTERVGHQCYLDDEDWEAVKGILGGTLPSRQPSIPWGTPSDNPVRVIHTIESKLKTLDEVQQKIAFEVPKGPQRLRGLAGTGKTVLLAKRAAKMHASNPNWTIAFIFFTRSLYDQILELISLYYHEMRGDEPDWQKVKVLHAWGGRQQAGFYHDLALKCGVRPKRVDDVTRNIGRVSPGDAFEYICECLEHKCTNIPEIYDALLIDEGQDLPSVFYRLAYKTLKQPKRFYWAYDEAQGIGSLVIPNAESIFGRTSDGNLLVDVRGSYEGGISKSHKMKRCYRTPRILLMTAHAINMGLFRNEGILQGVTNQNDWEDLGYQILAGDFTPTSVSQGRTVTITRTDSESPHLIDQADFELKDIVGSPLIIKTFITEIEEQSWVAEQVALDLQLGLEPWDIIITALSGDQEKDYFLELKKALKDKGVNSYIAGIDGEPNIFRRNDCVTISNIFRSKGNEAWKVYGCRFHYTTQLLEWRQETELQKRNEAFVALTRAKVWCVATGIESPIFDELRTAVDQYPNFTFPSFNKNSLRRVTEDESVNSQSSQWRIKCPNWQNTC